jgi:hypothetical protein
MVSRDITLLVVADAVSNNEKCKISMLSWDEFESRHALS